MMNDLDWDRLIPCGNVESMPGFSPIVFGFHMDKFDPEFLYTLGKAVDGVNSQLGTKGEKLETSVGRLLFAIEANYLKGHLRQIKSKIIVSPATAKYVSELTDLLEEAAPDGFLDGGADKSGKFLHPFRGSYVAEVEFALQNFDTHLRGDFLEQSIYTVARTGAYDTRMLLEEGEQLVTGSGGVLTQYPKVLDDVRASARCLAFDLWTASGFHIARATESLLQEYWQFLRNKTIPLKMTWVSLCRDLQGASNQPKAGDQALIGFIAQMGETYRNPLIHPEHTLNEKDCQILLEGCKASMIKILDELP